MGLVEETSILTSHVATGQSGPDGCTLVGSVHFNIGTYRFGHGEAQFLLKNAEIRLHVDGCNLGYPAYVQKFSESFEGKSKTELKQGDHSGRKIKATAQAKNGEKGPPLTGELSGEISSGRDQDRSRSVTLTGAAGGERIVFSYSEHGGRWLFSGRDLHVRGRSVFGLLGNHLQQGTGAKGTLAVLGGAAGMWSVRLSLSFGPADVEWWEFSSPDSKFAALLELLSKRERPEAFISKAALAKWLSRKVHAEPFFEHWSSKGID